MRIIFSRKGFDSSSGGFPSPIVNDTPVSLYIPTSRRSETTYAQAGLGELVEQVTRGKLSRTALCHEDPVFASSRWAFGQTGRAQSHLESQGVGLGDYFLFFGLFSQLGGKDRHHRIYGWMKVEEIHRLGAAPTAGDSPAGFPHRHPHTIGEWEANNTIYIGTGAKSAVAYPGLRLTKAGSPVSTWAIPSWLCEGGLSGNPAGPRWSVGGQVTVAGRGQEFVADIGGRTDAIEWLDTVRTTIGGDA